MKAYADRWPHGSVQRYWHGCDCVRCSAKKHDVAVTTRPQLLVTRYRCRCGQLHQTPIPKTCGCGQPIGWAI
jgi:hypothetical protein